MPIYQDRILFVDDHLLAVNKRGGELTVKAPGKLDTLPLLDFLKKDYPDIHPVNRLDFETSGVVLFARGKKTLATILKQDTSAWKKVYRTIVAGDIERKGGVIHFPLKTRMSKEKGEAETLYRVLEHFPVACSIEAEIKTGRHHQIRQHFAMINHPLLFDGVYGDKKVNQRMSAQLKYWKFFLHAASLSFKHPITNEQMTIEAPMPRQFEDCLKKLRAI